MSSRHQAVSCNIIYISLYIKSVREISLDFPTAFALKIFHPSMWIIPLITPSINPFYLLNHRRHLHDGLHILFIYPTKDVNLYDGLHIPFIYPTKDVNLYGELHILISTQPKTSTYTVDCISLYSFDHPHPPAENH